MLKKVIFLGSFLFLLNPVFSQKASGKTDASIVKFLKGNISDKTAAVREASGEASAWLSNTAIDFALENKPLLGNDRELEGLAVAATLSISQDYLASSNEEYIAEQENQFIKLFTEFDKSSTVQIAVLTKIVTLKDIIPVNSFVNTLNNYLKTTMIQDIDSSVFKTMLTTFNSIGNSESFIILYSFLNNQKYAAYHTFIETTISELIPVCMNETIALIETSNMKQLSNIFALSTNNSKISKNNLCEISEKVLSKSILLMNNTSMVSPEDVTTQINALKILTENKWTRASAITNSYFLLAKVLYARNIINEDQFITTINAQSSVAPIDSVSSLTAYLEELNNQKEKGNYISTDIILSVIKTLGAIGEKSAFDSLLAVTYLNYEESVLTAAREALSGLRW